MANEQRFPIRFDLTGEWAITQGADWNWPIRLEVDTLPAPPFVQSTPYVVGNYLVPQAGAETGFTYVVVTSGTSAASNPTWPTVLGGRVVSGGADFMAVGATRMLDTGSSFSRFTVRDEYGGASYVFASDSFGGITTDFDPPHWVANTAYALGQQVLSQTFNGWLYQCVDAGTSDATPPSWPTTPGATVVDGGVIWRNVGSDAGASNLLVQLSAAYTAGLTNWGPGLYDLEIVDAFGVTTRLFEGNAELRREVTT